MRRSTTAVLIALLLVPACSDDTTGPADDNTPDQPGSFSVSYTAENDRAVSETLIASAGGTVEATGSDGVTYRLTIPAGALTADTNVTIVPVSDLAVDGPGSFICAASCGSEDCCVAGALFEPEGLVFDTLVTLEIAFPAASPFPFDSAGGIFLFDSPNTVLAACESRIDFDAKTLTTRIWHFSGYGTGAADCPRLTELYLMMKAYAEAYAGMDAFFYCLFDLIHVVSWNRACDSAGIAGCRELCAGLDDMVISAARSTLGMHLGALLALHPASPATPGDVEDLVEQLVESQRFSHVERLSYDIGQFADALRGRILEMAQTIAADGRSLCAANMCMEGQSLLAYVISLGDRGYITDAAFLANVRSWYEDCCGFWRLSMSVDRTEILRAMITEGDEEMCVGTVTLRLTTSSGQPVEGVFLDCDMGYGHYLPGGDSDANGEYRVSFSSRILGYGERFNCAETVTKTLNSSVYNSEAQEWTEADPIVITFRNFTLSTTVNYSFTATERVDAETFYDTNSTITGNGTNYASTIYLCEGSCMGTIMRAYTSSGCIGGNCGETTIIGGAEVPGCCIIADIDTYNRGDGVLIPALVGLNFLLDRITNNVLIRSCQEGECSDVFCDIRSLVDWPPALAIPGYWENTTGSFEPFTWGVTKTSETGHSEAMLTLTLEVSY